MNFYLRQYQSASTREERARVRFEAAVDDELLTELRGQLSQDQLHALEEAGLILSGADPNEHSQGLAFLKTGGLTDSVRAFLKRMDRFPWRGSGGARLYECTAFDAEASVYHNPFYRLFDDPAERFEFRMEHANGAVIFGRAATIEEAQRMAEIAILHPYIETEAPGGEAPATTHARPV